MKSQVEHLIESIRYNARVIQDDGRVQGLIAHAKYHAMCDIAHQLEKVLPLDQAAVQEGLEAAWGIIANVSDGNWGQQGSEWVLAAKNWSDKYVPELSRRRAEEEQQKREEESKRTAP